MFFKGLKEKSIQKAITKHNNSRQLLDGNSKIKTVGFLVNVDHISVSEKELTLICNAINAENKGVLNFTEIVKKTNEELGLLSPKNIGWKANLKLNKMQEFCNTPFDVLITLSLKEDLYFNCINAFSQSRFKVAICNDSQDLNDLVINTDTFNVDVFAQELKKYLTILNKI